MEENEKEKNNTSNFKAVQNPTTYKVMSSSEKTPKSKVGFGRGILLPFFSGVVGCAVVIGTCFGIPSIRNSIFNNGINNTSYNSSNSSNSGLVSQTSLSNYSDTSIYAANKILPSIVGIKVEYNVIVICPGKRRVPSPFPQRRQNKGQNPACGRPTGRRSAVRGGTGCPRSAVPDPPTQSSRQFLRPTGRSP